MRRARSQSLRARTAETWPAFFKALLLLASCFKALLLLASCAPVPSVSAVVELPPLPAVPRGPVSPMQDVDVELEAPQADWCIHGGAALVGDPVIDDRGRVYLVTSDGYLHAFEADGRYRFSYTVDGTPLGSISLRPSDGAILLGTTAQRVYAINQSGRLLWSFATVTPVWSGIHPLDPRTVVFIGLDERLYALSTTGAARYRVPVPGVPIAEPLVERGGVVWVPLHNGLARIEQALGVERIPFSSPVEVLLSVGDGGLVALSGGHVWTIDQDSNARKRGEAQFLAAHGRRWLAASEDGTAVLVQGEEATPIEVPAGLADHPLLTKDTAYFPMNDGSLRWGKGFTLPVTDEPLRTPLLDTATGRLVVPTASGRVCSVLLPQGGPPGDEPQ